MNTLNALTSLLLFSNLAFHVRHFNAKSHAVHIVLQEAYELCEDFADDIGEQFLALNPQEKVVPNYYLAPGLAKSLESQDDIDALASLINKVIVIHEGLKVNNAPASVINIVEARLSQLNQTLYRLRLAYEV